MKSYRDVVRDRYDGREAALHVYENQYSLLNPVGFYGIRRVHAALRIVFDRLRTMGIDVTTQRILDVGCGSGLWTRQMAELTQAPHMICGMDLSAASIATAQRMNPGIRYFVGDVVDRPFAGERFDLITAFVVLMHLNTEAQVGNVLQNVRSGLRDGGFFLWYELLAPDHFAAGDQSEGAGYSRQQMLQFAQAAGLRQLFAIPLFKRLLWRHHSTSLCRRFPLWFVWLLEKTLPGPAGNIIMVFQKA